MRVTIIAHRMDSLALAAVSGIDVIAETKDVTSLSIYANTACDIVLMDIDNVENDEIREIKGLFPTAKLVGLIGKDSDPFVVVEAQRAGCDEFVRKPLEADDITTILRARDDASDVGKIIAIIAANGGAGATTIACNLAVQLASNGKVGLIDADLTFGGVAQYFDLPVKHTIADVCDCDQIDMVALNSAMTENDWGVHVLARPENIAERAKITASKISAVLHTAVRTFQYVVVDLPRQLDDFVGNIVMRSNPVLIVAEMNVASVSNAKRIRSAFLEEGLAENRVGVVLNRTTKRSAHALTEDDMRQTLGPLFALIPNDFPAALQASDQGIPIDSSSRICKAIQQMAATIAGNQSETVENKSRFMRLLKGGVS